MTEIESKANLLKMNSILNRMVYNSNAYINYLHKFFKESDLHRETFGNYANFKKTL